MRLLGTAFLFLLLVSINCILGSRLSVGENSLPPLGRFLSPQEGFWRNATPIDERPPEHLVLKGLSGPVEVVWDESGVPHLFARNDSDLYRAQGHLVARLRLWQMDLIALAAAGRLSEVMGVRTLDFDRLQRRKGMGIGAKATEQALMADSLMAPLLLAYADGVNQHIATLRYRDLPLEYKLLDHRPFPWSPLRSVFIQQYMVENLSGWDNDVENSLALRSLGPDLFELLFPERPPGVEPTVPTDAPWPWTPDPLPVPAAGFMSGAFPRDPSPSDPSNGSNNWAVSGMRTASGRPLLANDTHLGLNLPPIWIPIQLGTPEHRVFGFTLPGACGLVIGHNEHAAWGVTNAPRDTRDWYHITWRDAGRTNYLYNGEWLPVEYQVEEFKVRGSRMQVDSIRLTLHGPVVFEESDDRAKGRAGLALRWSGHEPTMTQKALYLMNRVQDHSDYVGALEHFHAPAQNWVFAAVDGTIAMRVQGRFPIKWKGQGRFVLDGALPEHRWNGYIPFAHTATQVDPARGFVSSANQHSVDERYPYWFHHGHLEHFRNRRINALLREGHDLTPEDMMQMQHDAHDLKAAEGIRALVPLLDPSMLDQESLEVLELLDRWDHHSLHDREERALFDRWFEGVRSALGASLKHGPVELGEVGAYTTILILSDSTVRARAEEGLGIDMRTIVREQFQAMVDQRRTEGPVTWGALNNARVTHLANIPALGHEDLPVNGSGTALNAQRGNHGPSQRFVVELSDPPQAWYQLPGGVDGNPGSKRYDDLLTEWHTMNYRKARFLRNAREGMDAGMPHTVIMP